MIDRDSDVRVIKKNGNRENFTPEKIKAAITKSAVRAGGDVAMTNHANFFAGGFVAVRSNTNERKRV